MQTKPKVFISYSWTSPGHCDLIRSYAERLVLDGIEVVLDQWELSEGQDKYVFMEKMVQDVSVTHVLVFSDKKYSEKANARKAGVGTESQIMSKEIYEKTDQKKFIPLVCERREDGEPYLPTFFHPRISIDFSSPEKANENWERLIRALYGKPIHTKPALGKPPSYLLTDTTVPLPTVGKFAMLKEALLNNKQTLVLYRNDFFEAAFEYADSFKIRGSPDVTAFHERILKDLRTMLPLRDQFIDWILLDSAVSTPVSCEESLIVFLEKLLALRYRPDDVQPWNDIWYDAQRIFVYEVFLYIVAALIRNNKYDVIRSVLTNRYVLPESQAHRSGSFADYEEFYGHSQVLSNHNQRSQSRRISPVADLIKERSTRTDLVFRDVMQAELILFVNSAISNLRWCPQTLIYAGYGARFPFFVRATQHKHFEKIKVIFGVTSADELREKFKEGCKSLSVSQWHDFTWHADVSFWQAANMEALDTLQ